MYTLANFDTPPGHALRSRHVRSDDTCSEKLGASPVVARLPTHLVARARFQVLQVVLLPSSSDSKPISMLVLPVAGALCADVSACRLYTPPERSNSIRPLFLSLKNVPPELRNTMMLPLSATCPAEMNEFCTRVVLRRDLEVARYVDSSTAAPEDLCTACPCESSSSG